MSDEGDKTCPICTEEMDLTDQQLKPCKCGYEICVWCWHHIMDMAEKEDTEGRCPACRKPYDKEKIVGMAASCERLVAEISSERKLKAQKAKPKASEGRKHLSSVRVIQRNLVYIIGLPLNLADEDLLQRKEYFGQYGKVLKVSISRTAGGAIQHSANNTCSVYITYSKEEEAVRCIQSVHGFVLEGRSLRACFGTTKYCHAWIRNVPCNNPDCLYLHDMGTQEDSFTKDEIISAYTRSRVQQITGATTNLQRRSGNTLPPPIDDYCNNSTSSTGKPIIKNASNQNAASQVRCSPPSCSSGRSISLPLAASWGTRISNCSQPAVNPVCSIGPTKQKPDILNNSGVHPTTDASISQSSTSPVDIGKKYMVPEESPTSQADGRLGRLESTNQYVTTDCLTTLSNVSAEPVVDAISAGVTSSSHTCVPASIGKDGGILHTNTAKYVEFAGLSSDNGPEKGGNIINDGNVQSLCYGMSSINIEGHHRNEQMEAALTNSLVPNSSKSPGNQGLQQYSGEQFREPLYATASRKSPLLSSNGVCSVREQSEWRPDSHLCVLREACGEVEGNALGLNNQGLNDTDVFSNLSYFPRSSHLPSISNHSSLHSWQQNEVNSASKINADAVTVHKTVEEASFLYTSRNSISSNGYNESKIRCSAGSDGSFEHSILLPNAEKGKHIGRFSDIVSNDGKNPALDMGESRIISNILSMDIDAWDEKHGCFKLSSSWKGQNSNQSRFSFARQEDFSNQVNNMDPFDMRKECSSPQDSLEQRGSFVDKFRNGFSSTSFDESDTSSGHYIMPSNKLPVSRVQISAPPGFSGPSRVPPPGFSFHDRVDQAFDSSVNCLLEVPFLLENQYQASSAGNFSSNGDVEFIDPAILAVGKGRLPNGLNNSGLDMRPALPAHLSATENEARLRLAMQQAISGNQNLRFSGHTGDRFSPWNEGYGIPSRLMEQAQASYLSPISQLSLQQQSRAANLSNGSWDVWTEAQTGSDLGIGDLMRNERLGVNKNFQAYEDLKFRRHPGNLYNRAFGM